ncbi:DinB family protein [Staphylococcus sp. GSSP0090]|nr:DinB family protein [Staphylococcus sp. GSSP0090]
MIKQQFKDSYKLLNKHLKDVDEAQAIVQPDGTNNNIKWQLGHLILLNDFLVFETMNGENVLEQPNAKYFLWGTSPMDFDGNEPSFEELKLLLNEQIDSIVNGLEAQFKKVRSKPIELKDAGIVMENFEESSHFAVIHMNRHFGQIVMLKSMINKLS